MERTKSLAKISARHRVPITSGEYILHLRISPRKTSSCHFPCRINRKQPSVLSLAWDSRALSPHMTLAVCTRLPNAYNTTPANGAICGKSLLSNLSVSFSLSSPSPSLFLSPFSLSSFCTYISHDMKSRLSPSVRLSYTLCQFHVFKSYTVRYFHLINSDFLLLSFYSPFRQNKSARRYFFVCTYVRLFHLE